MEHLLTITAAALRKAALNEEAKQYILFNKPLFYTLKKAADRYIGGETLAENIDKAIVQNSQGFKCSIEFMGENTATVAEVQAATAEFLCIVDSIHDNLLRCTVSLDLSHIGLALSRGFCQENLHAICARAAKYNIEVIISAEGTDKTDDILHVYQEAAKTFSNVSITLQAYLYRTADDFKEVLKSPGRIRMVKGAFETAPGLSMPRGSALDEVYLGYVDTLLREQHLCAIATHHDYIQQQAKQLVRQHQADKSRYEFESLYGIQGGQLAQLRDEGHPAKVYFVYGKEWYLYVCNRIAEHPLNLLVAMNDIVGG
ncbi:proline dehydrogenase family protein [Chitinophaga sedimenti]|uniref:proline dehydrogenase family protein n=1 Tax=Chitinophaga sedimenti TaxID=2033606 RepID=UPI002005C23C|nr:proline dehydrogenase family protein [Chitinophaga sedimenti]MCK7553996.1 proline dehydrogenase family protein [Chitinophaga sedimenti]